MNRPDTKEEFDRKSEEQRLSIAKRNLVRRLASKGVYACDGDNGNVVDAFVHVKHVIVPDNSWESGILRKDIKIPQENRYFVDNSGRSVVMFWVTRKDLKAAMVVKGHLLKEEYLGQREGADEPGECQHYFIPKSSGEFVEFF